MKTVQVKIRETLFQKKKKLAMWAQEVEVKGGRWKKNGQKHETLSEKQNK
jgi:hypothetical protein